MEEELVPHLMTLTLTQLANTSLTLWVQLPLYPDTLRVEEKWECILKASRRVFTEWEAARTGSTSEAGATLEKLSGNLIDKVATRYSEQRDKMFETEMVTNPAFKHQHEYNFQMYFMPQHNQNARQWEITSLIAAPAHGFSPDAICFTEEYIAAYNDLANAATWVDPDHGKYELIGCSTFLSAPFMISAAEGTTLPDLQIVVPMDAAACNSADLLDSCVQQLNSRLLLLENKALYP